MKIFLDANLPKQLVSILKEQLSIDSRRDEDGLSDEQIYELCRREKRVLLTLDNDYLNIIRYPPGRHEGIVVLRPKTQGQTKVTSFVLKFLQKFRDRVDILKGATISVKEDRVRIYRPEDVGPS